MYTSTMYAYLSSERRKTNIYTVYFEKLKVHTSQIQQNTPAQNKKSCSNIFLCKVATVSPPSLSPQLDNICLQA